MLVPISLAAAQLGVCSKTLRRWEVHGFITPSRTTGNHRRYDMDDLNQFIQLGVYEMPLHTATKKAAVYAQVSAVKLKLDLQTRIISFESRPTRSL